MWHARPLKEWQWELLNYKGLRGARVICGSKTQREKCVCVCVSTCVHMCVHVCAWACACPRVCVHVSMSAHVHVCVCVHVWVHVHMHVSWGTLPCPLPSIWKRHQGDEGVFENNKVWLSELRAVSDRSRLTGGNCLWRHQNDQFAHRRRKLSSPRPQASIRLLIPNTQDIDILG